MKNYLLYESDLTSIVVEINIYVKVFPNLNYLRLEFKFS